MSFEQLLPFEAALAGRKILVTGHTGFTGGWACSWLESLGAHVSGFSLQPDTVSGLYDELGFSRRMPSILGDICDYALLLGAVEQFQPEMILHLAAQPGCAHGSLVSVI